MLWKLIRSHLGPYAGAVSAVAVLQLVSTVTSLYLPSLNGQIIDDGVAKGDTGFILRAGAIMLGVSIVNILATVAIARFAPPRPRPASHATCVGRSSTGSGTSRPRSSPTSAPRP
jgi:ABC-type multidrug transport system fused ATPase/permease subunit